MKDQKDQTKPLSIKEWIFCIIGIVLLTSFMVLPPLFRIVFAEDEFTPTLTPTPPSLDEEGKEPETVNPIDLSKYDQVICVSNIEEIGDSKITQIFAHQDKKLKVYVEKTERTFSQSKEEFDLEESKEGSCSLPPKEYLNVSGFEYQCGASNSLSETLVVMENRFDLKRFSDTTVTIGEEIRVLSVPYYLDQDVDAIQSNLEAQNYSCQIKPVTENSNNE